MTKPILFLRRLAALAVLALLATCGPAYENGPPAPEPGQIAALERAILALSPDVSPAEAARAADIAYRHPLDLARQYQITDPPVRHNQKVNMGLKPRGLCWHWAEDMQRRLAAEGFRTLDLHRAIALPATPFRLEHSTVIVSAAGDGMMQGLVLDPWRWGGKLYWSRVPDDPSYRWQSRREVFSTKQRRRAARAR